MSESQDLGTDLSKNSGCNFFGFLRKKPKIVEESSQAAIKRIAQSGNRARSGVNPADTDNRSPMDKAIDQASSEISYNRSGKPKIDPNHPSSTRKDKYGNNITSTILPDGTLIAYNHTTDSHVILKGPNLR